MYRYKQYTHTDILEDFQCKCLERFISDTEFEIAILLKQLYSLWFQSDRNLLTSWKDRTPAATTFRCFCTRRAVPKEEGYIRPFYSAGHNKLTGCSSKQTSRGKMEEIEEEKKQKKEKQKWSTERRELENEEKRRKQEENCTYHNNEFTQLFIWHHGVQSAKRDFS